MEIHSFIHPTRIYWGHVNPIGERACYDEGKRSAETLFLTTSKTMLKLKLSEYSIHTDQKCIQTMGA
jgi:hypothetical protein